MTTDSCCDVSSLEDLQRTYEIETEHLAWRRREAEKDCKEALEAMSQMDSKGKGLFGTIKIAASGRVDVSRFLQSLTFSS